MNNEKLTDYELPLGLGMAFAQNTNAMQFFSALPRDKQKNVIDKAYHVNSKEEMQALVNSLGAEG